MRRKRADDFRVDRRQDIEDERLYGRYRTFTISPPHACGGTVGIWNRYNPACRRCGGEVPAPPPPSPLDGIDL